MNNFLNEWILEWHERPTDDAFNSISQKPEQRRLADVWFTWLNALQLSRIKIIIISIKKFPDEDMIRVKFTGPSNIYRIRSSISRIVEDLIGTLFRILRDHCKITRKLPVDPLAQLGTISPVSASIKEITEDFEERLSRKDSDIFSRGSLTFPLLLPPTLPNAVQTEEKSRQKNAHTHTHTQHTHTWRAHARTRTKSNQLNRSISGVFLYCFPYTFLSILSLSFNQLISFKGADFDSIYQSLSLIWLAIKPQMVSATLPMSFPNQLTRFWHQFSNRCEIDC